MKKNNPHSLLRLAASLRNVPHLITPQAFGVVLDYLDRRNSDVQMYDEHEDDMPQDMPKKQMCENGLGILKVDGSLTARPLMTMCGEVGTSYASLIEQCEAMAAEGCRTMVMEVTSPGGQASHCFEAAQEIRNCCDEHNIKLIGYCDEMACSAAYALIAVCDEVVANPSGELGSIGCVICLTDASKAMEQAGLKRIFITSGSNKVPFENDGTFKQEFLDSLQEEVSRLNMEFATHVSKFTGIPVDDIVAMEADTFNAQEAVEKGLANKVMTRKQFAAYVAEIHKGAMYA